MKKELFRLVFGFTFSLAFGLAMAQNHSSQGGGGSSSSGGSHSSGGGSGSSGGGSHSSGGGYSGGSSSRPSGGGSYSGSRSSGNSAWNGGGTSRYSQGSSSSSRYQRSNQGYTGQSRSESSSGSRYSNSNSRYSSGSSSRYSSGSNSRYSSGSQGASTSRSGSGGYQERGLSSSESGLERGHANMSRGGGAGYAGNNNLNGAGHAALEGGHFGAAPHGLIGPSTLGHVIGDNHIGLVRGGFRTGYFGYFGGWRDSFFAFNFYVFDPFFAPCYCSPWYYYPCLPAYIAAPRVIIVDSYPSANWSGSDYDWQPGNRETANPVLDDSVQDLVEAFENDDHKAIDRAVPHSGNVNIYVDGKYSYTLKANDFYDTYVDGIESTKTDRYEVLEVKANANGTARVVAKHVYNDPWGNRTYVYHSYFLVKEGDEYVIREFGTSDYRTGW